MALPGFSRRIGFGLGLLTVITARDGLPAQSSRPSFAFSLSCPEEIRTAPGAAFEREVDLVLDTVSNSTEEGASGWGFSVAAEGVDIVEVRRRGTPAWDLIGCPTRNLAWGDTCPELKAYLATCGDRTGGVGGAVLGLTGSVSLPPLGAFTMGRIRIAGRAPQNPGETTDALLEFVDGCLGVGHPVTNVVTWGGESFPPALGACTFTIVAVEPTFSRGDANGDGTVDISDPIYLLGCKFLGTACSRCEDGADANDDGQVDVSDAIAMLGYILLGWSSPPSPGPACGPDPTADELPLCEESCET